MPELPVARGSGDDGTRDARIREALSPRHSLKVEVNYSQAPTPAKDNVDQILGTVGKIAILPQVAFQIAEVTLSEDARIDHLEKAISVDPGLAARLIAQANSAFYALPKRVTSIREAVMFLGFQGVREIVTTIGVYDAFLGKNDHYSLRRRDWWRESLEVAVVSKTFAEHFIEFRPDEAYTCGLLHLIGKSLLDKFSPENYTKVQRAVEQGAPDLLAERAVFGSDHIRIAVAATSLWGFPEVLTRGVDYFTPDHEASPENALRACTALASRAVRHVRGGRKTEDFSNELVPGWILDALQLTDNRLMAVLTGGFEALEKTKLGF